MKYAIETFDLTKKYGDFTAVDSLNMKIKNKTIFGFLGPNGAGKTTTIKMLTCLIPPTSGTAKVAGYDIIKEPDNVRQKIGMVPQLVSLYKDLTVRENIELCADFYGMPPELKEERINELMEMVDIKYAENKLVRHLSGGQQQKVSLVASLIHQPEILFLDEPTIGLDPTTKRVLWDLISELNDEGHTIILCSHDMYEVELLCDHVGIINQGVLAAFDTPQALKDAVIKEKESKVAKILKKIKEESEKDEIVEREGREISVFIVNLTDEIIEEIEKLPIVMKIKKHHRNRITIKIDERSENGVNTVIRTILDNDGIIKSISTKDPSLEDVFIKVTSEKVK
ncbi:ATP-binding cassette domain-containing protein [Methanothermobacter tenebrarum]|uniref:Daunorubicin ABC transporter ATP-binding protein n=1 Tax=Methanothermobacter tenebrarum TaxID=680118 RepID=A0A328PHM0_9EURY|nr:ATP-binding cassette domain-containing protein [Methanothermobacter tenebrarum]MBC7100677.1 ATP-binding cassette domain-containing protein [Methanobacteriales archaeon]MBC7117775.1 ATP-binding cassette domain-containing protein [Methanobacteriaceae archaeon]NPV65360.1 ATP-binding cassette domain-containing protein [Methanobacteriaceae archaeon]RAO78934.1 daunorubicin ABC transporter ATP-binding protein [Methanothermobacter tenebrarum]